MRRPTVVPASANAPRGTVSSTRSSSGPAGSGGPESLGNVGDGRSVDMHHLRRRSLERRKELPIDKKILQPKDSYIQISIVRIKPIPSQLCAKSLLAWTGSSSDAARQQAGGGTCRALTGANLEAPIVLRQRSSYDHCRVPRCGQEERSAPIFSVSLCDACADNLGLV